MSVSFRHLHVIQSTTHYESVDLIKNIYLFITIEIFFIKYNKKVSNKNEIKTHQVEFDLRFKCYCKNCKKKHSYKKVQTK